MSQRKSRKADEAGYDFELEKVVGEIKRMKAKHVGLQFPEGLKKHAVEVASMIEEATGARTVIFIGPVYGACDTKQMEAEMLGLDLVVHFGHTAMKPVLGK